MPVPSTSGRRISTLDRQAYERDCRIYFIEAAGLDLIKIGYAIDLQKRFTGLMTASPAPLTLLGVLPGGPKLEAEIHEKLAAHRAHGEWFRKTPEVMAMAATAQPSFGQEWLNQVAKVRGAALRDYLAKLKAGEITRPGRGPAKRPKRTENRYAWSSQ